jgi:CxxC motif-containing protein (DUF1111 family)
VGWATFGVIAASAAWMATPGLPVLRAPRAGAATRAAGLALFEHEWRPGDALAKGDGLGPVFNARSCVACHFQGGVGGGGDNAHNVLAFEAHPTRDRPGVKGGLIHKFAVDSKYTEKCESLREFFPIVPGGVRRIDGCSILTLDFNPVRTEAVNSTALFGAGWIDRIPGKTISHEEMKRQLSNAAREIEGDFRSAIPGRYRVLPDGRVGKFGWKAQFATLREFVAAACANEIGLGNPEMEQARPMVKGGYPAVPPDLDARQFRALVAFVDTLPRPEEVAPGSPGERMAVDRGKALFRSVGCAACHTPDLAGVAGVYSDFLLHRLEDRSNGAGSGGYGSRSIPEVPLPVEHPLPEEWKTPPLWGVADSAPYFHDGGSPTLASAILRHRGDAEAVTVAYRALTDGDRAAVLVFLKTLRAPTDPRPADSPPTALARAR